MDKDERTSEVSKSRKSGRRRKSRRDSRHKSADDVERTDTEQTQDQTSQQSRHTQDRTLDKSRPSQDGSHNFRRVKERPQQEVNPVLQGEATGQQPVPEAALASTPTPSGEVPPTAAPLTEEPPPITGPLDAKDDANAAPSEPGPNQDVVQQTTRVATAAEPSEKRDLLPLVALFLAVTFAIVIVFVAVQSNLKRELCTTASCASFAKLVDESVNASTNPCDSFGRFVCDGWRSKSEVSVRESVFRAAIEATVESVSRVAIPDTNQDAAQQTAALFRSCYRSLVKADAGSARDEVALVRAYLAEAGVVWPWVPSQPDVLETSVFLAFELGWPAVLDFKVKSSSAHSSTVIVEPSAGFTRLMALVRTRGSSEIERKRYFDALVLRYGDGDIGNVSYSDIQDAELLMTKRLRDALSLRNWTMLDSKDMHPGVSAWAAALARRNVTGALRFASSRSSFVAAFSELWEEYGNDRMHLFVSWCAVQYVSIFTSRDTVLASAGGTRLPSWTYSPSICLMFTYGVVGDAIFVPYSKRVLKPGVRSDVAKLLFSVRKSFTKRFEDDPVFSSGTAMLTEWASVKGVFEAFDYRVGRDLNAPFLGYPDMTSSFVRNWRNASRMRHLADTDANALRTIDAILNSQLYTVKKGAQDFVLLPFALTFPMYNAGTSVAIKYGTLGALLARASAEVALDYYGRQEATKERLEESRECFAKDARTMSIAPRDNVMLETVALEALLDAVQEAFNQKRQNREGLSSYSALETVFISWCLMKCAVTPNERSADVDPCSAPLRHVRRFSDTFDCHPETSLNPVRKCRVF
ncbi:hypothetical protein HPB50_022915 [Hyalomma asiaticum]|uniref:Uncharacterized protein n=1 Tax=Hyalomma asiaticum TaxID=266040 RepID=A0ACB7SKP1_HYAAI|nr:hypothetical protein HPB50_022915 [Hyalomma asiaticum]